MTDADFGDRGAFHAPSCNLGTRYRQHWDESLKMNISRRAFLTAASATAMTAACPELLKTASSALAAPIPLAAPTKALTRPVLIGTSLETGLFKNFACSLSVLKSSPGYAYPAILDENG